MVRRLTDRPTEVKLGERLKPLRLYTFLFFDLLATGYKLIVLTDGKYRKAVPLVRTE